MNPQRFGSNSSDGSWVRVGEDRDRTNENPLSALGQPRIISGTTTLKQCNTARGTSDPAGSVEWPHVEGCPPNVESDELASFMYESVSQCKAQIHVHPEGAIVVDFRQKMSVDTMLKRRNLKSAID